MSGAETAGVGLLRHLPGTAAAGWGQVVRAPMAPTNLPTTNQPAKQPHITWSEVMREMEQSCDENAADRRN